MDFGDSKTKFTPFDDTNTRIGNGRGEKKESDKSGITRPIPGFPVPSFFFLFFPPSLFFSGPFPVSSLINLFYYGMLSLVYLAMAC